MSAFSSLSALFSQTKRHFQLKLRRFMYNTTQHLTVAWFYYWIKALGRTEPAQCMWREMPHLCEMTHKCFCMDKGEKRRVRACEAGLCEQGGDGARGCSLTLWEPPLVEWTTLNFGTILCFERKSVCVCVCVERNLTRKITKTNHNQK